MDSPPFIILHTKVYVIAYSITFTPIHAPEDPDATAVGHAESDLTASFQSTHPKIRMRRFQYYLIPILA